MENKHGKTCWKCFDDFVWSPKEEYWNENGLESTKLVNCPYCNCPNVIKYSGFHNVNADERYY